MSSSTDRYDVAVVGVGLIGAAALRHLANSGVRCVGIGPDEPAHFASHEGAFASHYDSGRITRMLDPRFEWGLLAKRSIAAYGEIETAAEMAFHRPVGLVYTAKNAVELEELSRTADRLGITCQVGPISGTYPDSRLGLSEGWMAFVEPAPAGHIDPRVMRLAQLKVAAAHGADLIRQIAVSIEPIDRAAGGHRGWAIRLGDGSTRQAERVLVAAGPHADEILSPWGQLAYDVRNEAVVTAALDAAEQLRLAGLPSVIADVVDEATDGVYMVPPTPYPDGTVRIKLGTELFSRRTLATAQDRRAWMRGDEHLHQLPHLRRLLEQLVPGLRSSAWESKPCLIPHTPSQLPYIDHLDDGLVVAAGCNGFAAKSADAIGALAAILVNEARWTDAELVAHQFRAQFALAGR